MSTLPRPCILVIEDDPADAARIRDLFADDAGTAPVEYARSLAEGVLRLLQGGPDVALLDLSLPDVSGPDAIQVLRARVPGVPVVALGTSGDEGAAAEAVRAGADEYLPKSHLTAGALQLAVACARARHARPAVGHGTPLAEAGDLIEVLPHLMATADIDGRLLTLNRAGRLLLGLTEDERIEGLTLADIHAPEMRNLVNQDAIPTAINARVWSGETALGSASGEVIAASAVLAAHRDPNGQPQFLVLIAHDIRERKLLEEELLHAQKMEAVGRLAGGLAHDFNNLLLPIITYSDLLLSKLEVGGPLARYAQQIKSVAERAAALPRQLMAFSRRHSHQLEHMDPGLLVKEMEKMLRRLIGEDIGLAVEVEPGLGSIEADPVQVQQVLMNLVVNARDAMPGGGRLTVEVTNAELDATYARRHVGVTPGKYVLMTVSDTGCGMDKETLSHVFEPFFTTKESGKGTGLGLSMVYAIVTQNGGHLSVYSEPGHGTAFRVYLPRSLQSGPAVAQPVESSDAPGGAELVLLVEDDDLVRASAYDILERYGYRVLQANSPADALRLSEEHPEPIDLMLTDMVMPGMTGRDLARHMAVLRPEMKVVFMSGYTESAIVHGGVADMQIAFLQKPFSPQTLARKVREVLDAGSS